MGMSEREKHIENLIALKNVCKDNGTFSLAYEVEQSLDYAISSLKTDEAYQLMYEGEEIYTKDDIVAMLTDIQLEIEELDTSNNNDAYMTCSEVIQQKIDKLKGEEDGKDI